MHAIEHGRVFKGPSPADGRDYARRNHTLEYFSMYDYWRKNVSLGDGDKQPQEMAVGLTPAEYFKALGIRPRGRQTPCRRQTPAGSLGGGYPFGSAIHPAMMPRPTRYNEAV